MGVIDSRQARVLEFGDSTLFFCNFQTIDTASQIRPRNICVAGLKVKSFYWLWEILSRRSPYAGGILPLRKEQKIQRQQEVGLKRSNVLTLVFILHRLSYCNARSGADSRPTAVFEG